MRMTLRDDIIPIKMDHHITWVAYLPFLVSESGVLES